MCWLLNNFGVVTTNTCENCGIFYQNEVIIWPRYLFPLQIFGKCVESISIKCDEYQCDVNNKWLCHFICHRWTNVFNSIWMVDHFFDNNNLWPNLCLLFHCIHLVDGFFSEWIGLLRKYYSMWIIAYHFLYFSLLFLSTYTSSNAWGSALPTETYDR